MDTILTVKEEDLMRLNPEEVVEFFRKLLWAEAMRVGIPLTKITITTKIYTPDGGIDASVDKDLVISTDSFIQSGLNGFQIKAGENFDPWQDSVIKSELFGQKSVAKENLGKSIRNVLDNSGRYVIVCCKQKGLTVPQRRSAIDSISRYLQNCDYGNAKVDVWDVSNLLGYLNYFPSLSLETNGRAAAIFQTHSSWSRDAEMQNEFFPGQSQKDFIANLQSVLRNEEQSTHVRVLGEAGVGKTRLVFETTKTEELSSSVVFVDSASKFRDSNLMNEFLRDDKQFCSILVIDECDQDSRSYIWNKLQYRKSKIKLITIYNESDNAGGTIKYLEAPLLADEQTSKIIQSYGIPIEQADRYAKECSGSPRVAHAFGWNLKSNPEDLLRPPGTVNIWEKYVVYGDDPNSQEVEDRRIIIRYLALFKRFGIGPKITEEAKSIARIIEQAYPRITFARFQQIIKPLRDRKILQGENTLYISPKALHIKMWIEWWEVYGSGFNIMEFAESLSPILRKWFFEMFKYAAESQVSTKVVKELLGPNGPFQKQDYLRDEIGSDFFLALTEANPKSAIDCLQATIGMWSKEKLLEFTTGRRNVVWALERIAIHRDLFSGAARLLLALGEAENESWSNNASGVFAGLFSPGRSSVAPSQASPEERFPVLVEALKSPSKERRKLGLKACDIALQTHSFTRMLGAEYQGLKKINNLWSPKTYGELFDAYRRVWNFIIEILPQLPDDEKIESVGILLRHSRGLASMQNLTSFVIDSLEDLVDRSLIDKKNVLREIVQIIHYDAKEMEPAARERWNEFKQKLIGNDFSSLLKRYVGMQLLEDEYDSEGNRIHASQKRIIELATEIIKDPSSLDKELEWLVTSEAQNGLAFGYELGKVDTTFSLLDKIIARQKQAKENQSVNFLCGYFRAIFEKDKLRWENELETYSKDKTLYQWVPELTWRSGMTDAAALRVLRLAEEGQMQVSDFRMFAYGGVVRELTEDVFLKWVYFLINATDEGAIAIIFDLYTFFYLFKEKKNDLPEDVTFQILTHPSLVSKSPSEIHGQMIDYHWTQIAKAYISKFPSRSLDILGFILGHFGARGCIFEGYHSSTLEVLNDIARKYPSRVWNQVKKILGPPLDSREFHIRQWLRGEQTFHGNFQSGALSFLPSEEIFKWVDQDIENRAWYLSDFVPPIFFRREEELCWAREVLIRYGEREDVKRNLVANFSTEGWVGPESLHHQGKKDQLLEFRKDEPNENVKSWIDYYVSILDHEIERARLGEERDDY